MKKIIFLLLTFLVLKIHAQTANKDGEIVIGNLESLHSNILNEDRKIWVYIPNGANPETNDLEHFPVVYLLDGNAHFFATMSIIYHLSSLVRNTPCPKMIIVGIPNTNRVRDLTPSHASYSPMVDSSEVPPSGGGENFLAFIEKELIPHIDSLYPTTSYRTFVGHSFGGLTVINALINHTNLFNAYVAVDPSMSWDDQKLLKQSKNVLKENKFKNKSLFISRANNLDPKINSYIEPKEIPMTKFHMQSINQFIDCLKENNGKNGLRWKDKYYDEETHGTSPLPTEYDAFKFIFDYYRCNFINRLGDPKFNSDSALKTHYANVSNKMGYKVNPPEPLMNDYGYYFIQQKNYPKAYSFFQTNIEGHPTSWNVYDSMSDYYIAVGNKQKAIDCLTKALELKNNPSTKERLDKLKNEK